ncbi:MAG: glycosyltransferase [Nitrospiraceae bacterium]|nr:glycosyltransferase [Nitrospiraceae bacterium]
MPHNEPEISVVIPVFNEAPNLHKLVSRIAASLDEYGRPFEIIAVDDGSTDGSVEILREIQDSNKRLRVVLLARNFGQTPAVFAGFSHARGQRIVTIDADLQNPPEDIPKLLEKIEEGFDVVNGWRANRQDNLFRHASSRLLNAIVSRVTRTTIQDYGCALKAFRREVVDRLLTLTHHSRYLLVEAVKLGVRVAEIEVAHNERTEGKSKYSLFDLIRVNFDIITGITVAPLQFIGLLGWLFAFGGFAMSARVVYFRIRYGDISYMGTITALFFILAGIQMVATGLMCEYVGRIFIEVQNRPYYVVREVIE